jgi:hypothetical protein
MAVDPLAQFRKKPAEATTGAAAAGPGVYEAFKAVDRRQYRLSIRPANRAWERVTYSYLLRIVEDGAFGTEIALVYTFMVVVIKGKNLQPVAEAINGEGCEFIQEYDRDKWEKPTDQAAPFIESIEIHVEKPAAEVLAEAEAGGSRH